MNTTTTNSFDTNGCKRKQKMDYFSYCAVLLSLCFLIIALSSRLWGCGYIITECFYDKRIQDHWSRKMALVLSIIFFFIAGILMITFSILFLISLCSSKTNNFKLRKCIIIAILSMNMLANTCFALACHNILWNQMLFLVTGLCWSLGALLRYHAEIKIIMRNRRTGRKVKKQTEKDSCPGPILHPYSSS